MCFAYSFPKGMFYQKPKLLTLREHLGSSRFLVGFVLLIFLVFCGFFCPRPVSGVFNVASVSVLTILDYPFGFL
jgi:hypothetical protein